MSTPASHRLLLAGLALAAAVLACARAEVPIDSSGQSVATARVIPPTLTEPVLVLPSPTSSLAEATSLPSTTVPSPTPSPTAQRLFDVLPILNGTFDVDLSSWNVTPNWTLWQDGYARLNAPQAGQLVQITIVPRGREIKLHFSARSETASGGECVVESRLDTVYRFPADGQWHSREVDYTLEGGTQTALSLQAVDNGHCGWINLDDVYWLLEADAVAGNPPPSPTPAGPTPEGAAGPSPTPGSPTAAPASPTPAAIPAGASFTQAFTVSAVGDTPIGVPADLVDGQAITWASLRRGTGAWVFNLGGTRTLAGLRLLAHRDGDQDTTFIGVDVSLDGVTWTEVYTASGGCGSVPRCQVIPQGAPVDLAFGPTDAQYVRVRSGPTRFAFAEVHLALLGN